MTIEEGRIDRVQIYGDFLGTRGTTAPLERRLRGAQYNPEALQTVLQSIDVASYPGGLSTRRFLNLLYARR